MNLPSERAMRAAVEMEIQAVCSTTTAAKGKSLDEHFPAYDDLLDSLKELLAACESDCGVPDDEDGDGEPVGGGLDSEGNPDPMALTFGHMRRAAAAIAKASA